MVNQPPGQRPDSAFDGIDFEPTDISDARRAMDDLPPAAANWEWHVARSSALHRPAA
jgi:hypothetical protein